MLRENLHLTLDKWGSFFNSKRKGDLLTFDNELATGSIEVIDCNEKMDLIKFDVTFHEDFHHPRPKEVEEAPFITLVFGDPFFGGNKVDDNNEDQVINQLNYNSVGAFCSNSDSNLDWKYRTNEHIKLFIVRISKEYFNYYIHQDKGLTALMSLDKVFFVYEEFDNKMIFFYDEAFSMKSTEIFYKDRMETLGKAMLNRFFLNVSIREDITESNTYSFNIEPIFKAHRLLESTTDKIIPLEELSREVGLSESRLRFLFKQVFGMTITTFHTNVRLEKAKRLLRERQKTNLMIAMDLGFSSASHFSTAFKKKYKITPKEYQTNLSSNS
ncbi:MULTISPECIES: helix-turn-helix domain-containing protein [Flammeovirga]|uniref:Helix-turn-helix transcriptional regulator n=1 Tax=Flammeovirga agarivorans TaxID=2726742 RepID=A0A7X8SP53_9BACT|nr:MULTISPECIES: AraC family transcriptional regulator [Flammeovirga]NLR93743.1 helix-turn-helix transcriptional regulator [Flammeovirga agarivorans]